jgi:hypothetical protein
MLSSCDNRKVPESMISRWLRGLIDCWTAQVPQRQPADRENTDRAGSHDQNGMDVSAPSPPPTAINTINAPHMSVHN